MATDRLLRVNEVADRLGLSPMYVYQLMREGKIQSVKIGTRGKRIAESEIERYIRSQQ